jgi:hypothetical protein
MRSKGRAALLALVPMFAVLGLGAVSAAPAFAAAKPFVETNAATSLEETTATLNGVVNPNGVATKYWFEYGTEKGKLTSKTTEGVAGSGESNLKETAALTGLVPDKPYYFRVVAKNSDGTSDGAEATFETKGLPEFRKIVENKKLTFSLGFLAIQSEGHIASCNSGSGEGEILTEHTATATLHLKGCIAFDSYCTSSGAQEDEVVTNAIPVRLVYLSREKHEAALDLNYGNRTTPMFEAECTDSDHLGARGEVLVPIAYKEAKAFTMKLQSNEGVQTPKQYESSEDKLVTALPEVQLFSLYFAGALQDELVEMTTAKIIEVKA